ncbi:unnamed protein product [Gemmata massiliana]|uniref:Uncharacterized protein n=1 Tax=Gemmata massiliana TaxID=1210884 RepID=A0A6P2D0D4_9BACT|nr:hypothetical protein [Gemmata massiliana]VTR94056.1 unnamed protein product [Gemmata massiliana]
MNRTALKRLEQLAASLTCSMCKRSFALVPNLQPRKYQFTQEAVRELAALLVPARVTCAGCDRVRFDINLMPDQHKARALALFRAARGTES